MTDPFEDEDFDPASTAFLNTSHLLGRLLLVAGTELRVKPSTQKGAKEGSTYEVVVADVIVLDGPVDDMIPTVPFIAEGIHLSGQVLVGQVRNTAKTGKMVLGRMEQRPSANFPQSKGAWTLAEPTDADKAIARSPAKAYLKQRQEATDPFGN